MTLRTAVVVPLLHSVPLETINPSAHLTQLTTTLQTQTQHHACVELGTEELRSIIKPPAIRSEELIHEEIRETSNTAHLPNQNDCSVKRQSETSTTDPNPKRTKCEMSPEENFLQESAAASDSVSDHMIADANAKDKGGDHGNYCFNGSLIPDGALPNGDVDHDLYSRQIGAFGLETMNRLVKLKIIISGLRGVGVEIAKNVILAGPAEVLLHDDTLVTEEDLSSNFCLKGNSFLGQKRSDASKDFLEELNDYVDVKVHYGSLDTVIPDWDILVLSNAKRADISHYNALCRKGPQQKGFIYAGTFGLCTAIFVDFGNDFLIRDPDGEEPKSAIVAGISQGNPGIVSLHTDKPMPFDNSTHVSFREVEGMVELNDSEPRPIRVTDAHTFSIENTTKYSSYISGGIVVEVKVPKQLSFKPFEERCDYPTDKGESLITPDLGKMGRPEQLHFAIQALLRYTDAHCSDSAHAIEECVKLAKKFNAEAKGRDSSVTVDQIDEECVKKTVQYAHANFAPLESFVGGIAAQEVVKFTGKFTPIYQWFYYDCFDLLQPPPTGLPSHINGPLVNGRYRDFIKLFGSEKKTRLADLNIFVVGAGALGCEILKLIALTGCCTGKGQLTITDMDNIETSNLNRQFLFRRHHIGSRKSEVAASMAKKMNPELNIIPLTTKVSAETEDVFDDAFWERLDLVINALDNVPSRLYVDSQCVWYHKPLVESGTLGTKGNVQTIVPCLTESYGDSKDPPEESIPLCTLKHFPYEIEHVIEWARDSFQMLFTDSPQQSVHFLKSPDAFLARLQREGAISTQIERMCRIKVLLRLNSLDTSCEDPLKECVAAAMSIFNEFYNSNIQQLLYNFPLDHVNSSGQKFWSGPKRPPQPIEYDNNDPLHVAFVLSTAMLLAASTGLRISADYDRIRKVSSAINCPRFEPRKVYIRTEESDTTAEGGDEDDTTAKTLYSMLLQLAGEEGSQTTKAQRATMTPLEFEKDDATNFHVDFIWAAANLRARNYRITECNLHKAKMIAGRIIPAIATTTSMITGLVFIEAMKLVDIPARPLDHYRNAFVNLSTPVWVFSEPQVAPKITSKDYDPIACGPIRTWPEDGFSTWDKVEISKVDGTLDDLIKEVEHRAEVEVSIVSVGNVCLYNAFLPAHKRRLNEPIERLYTEISKSNIPPQKKYLVCELSCNAVSDGVDIVMPSVAFYFR